jgi:hypothetical protein
MELAVTRNILTENSKRAIYSIRLENGNAIRAYHQCIVYKVNSPKIK